MFNKSNTILKYVTVLVVVCTIFLGGGEKGQVNAATQEISLKKSAVSDNKSVKIVNKKKILYTDTWISLGVKLNEKKVKSNQLIWESSDSNIATISKKGKVSAKKVGSTRITVTLKKNKIKKSFVLSVKKSKPLKKIKITTKNKKLGEGDTIRLRLKRIPSNTTFKNVKWKSANKNIAVVSQDGIVTAKKAGKVIIKAREPFTKKTATIRLKIKHNPVTGIHWNSVYKTMEVGQKVQLSAQVTPENATNKKIIYSSSDKTKVSIDENGMITALRPTEYVVIRATSVDGKYRAEYTMKITKSTGYLTKGMLDRLNLTNVKKLMIVAHPDDETLWGGSHLIDSDYLVVCMSNGWYKKRSSDFERVMNQTGDPHIILDYPDIRKDWVANGQYAYEMDLYSTCKNAMQEDIELLLNYKKWDEVVTHNPDGEYGKLHHQMVSDMVSKVFQKSLKGKSKLYYFGHYYKKGEQIPGNKIGEENLQIKERLVNEYQPTAKGAIEAFGHMIPYENWVLEEDWK